MIEVIKRLRDRIVQGKVFNILTELDLIIEEHAKMDDKVSLWVRPPGATHWLSYYTLGHYVRRSTAQLSRSTTVLHADPETEWMIVPKGDKNPEPNHED